MLTVIYVTITIFRELGSQKILINKFAIINNNKSAITNCPKKV